jgi:hypothetical protein
MSLKLYSTCIITKFQIFLSATTKITEVRKTSVNFTEILKTNNTA